MIHKARKVTIKGKNGEITKDFRHMPLEIHLVKQNTKNRKGTYLHIKMWFAGKKQACSVSTLKSLIKNMIRGVVEVSTNSLVFYEKSLLNIEYFF